MPRADERRRSSRRLATRRPATEPRRGRSRLAAWVSARRADLVVLAAVVTPVAIAHAWGMTRYPAFFDDEGTYVSQAYAVDKLHTLAPYTYWYDHPPLGWMLLGGWAKLFPVFSPTSFAIAASRMLILRPARCQHRARLRDRTPARRAAQPQRVRDAALRPLATGHPLPADGAARQHRRAVATGGVFPRAVPEAPPGGLCRFRDLSRRRRTHEGDVPALRPGGRVRDLVDLSGEHAAVRVRRLHRAARLHRRFLPAVCRAPRRAACTALITRA